MNTKLQDILDLGEEVKGTMSPSFRASLDEMAQRAMNYQQQIEDKELEIKALKEAKNSLILKDLPTALHSVGLSSYITVEGISVDIQTIVQGSLPKDEDKRKVAIAFIKSNGGSDLFTNDVSISFGKGQEAEAQRVMDAIGALGFNHAQQQSTIHHQTLCAWMRECLAEGKSIEAEKLGLFVGPVAKIILSKKKRY